jgi:undecaprenyl-diphosphatase
MIGLLKNIDSQLFIFLNGFHNSFFDQVMWYISSITFWIPAYVILLAYLIFKNKKQSLYIVIAIALVILISDQVASGIIKPLAERLRPSQEPSLEGLVHIINGYKGGKFGFVSSHAANTFGLAMFLTLLFKNRIFSVCILAWAAIVSYSRIYLGVHYPGDIVGGVIIGLLAAWLVFKLYDWFMTRKAQPQNAGS